MIPYGVLSNGQKVYAVVTLDNKTLGVVEGTVVDGTRNLYDDVLINYFDGAILQFKRIKLHSLFALKESAEKELKRLKGEN